MYIKTCAANLATKWVAFDENRSKEKIYRTTGREVFRDNRGDDKKAPSRGQNPKSGGPNRPAEALVYVGKRDFETTQNVEIGCARRLTRRHPLPRLRIFLLPQDHFLLRKNPKRKQIPSD